MLDLVIMYFLVLQFDRSIYASEICRWKKGREKGRNIISHMQPATALRHRSINFVKDAGFPILQGPHFVLPNAFLNFQPVQHELFKKN